jgi:hypothetical protein
VGHAAQFSSGSHGGGIVPIIVRTIAGNQYNPMKPIVNWSRMYRKPPKIKNGTTKTAHTAMARCDSVSISIREQPLVKIVVGTALLNAGSSLTSQI